MLPSLRHGAARLEIAWHPIEGCCSIWPDRPFQCLCRGGNRGTVREERTRGLHLGGGGTRHPMPPFHPEVTKQSAGQAGTGAEAAAPCKICSITPRRKGEKGWEGREEADF